MNHSKQILKLRLTRAAQQTQQHHRAAESRPLRDAHEGDYVLLLVSDTDLTPKGMKTPHFIVYVLWQPSEWNFVEQWKLHHWSFFLSQPSMIHWSNSRVLRAGGWSEKPVERKQRCDWLRDGGGIFFSFHVFCQECLCAGNLWIRPRLAVNLRHCLYCFVYLCYSS